MENRDPATDSATGAAIAPDPERPSTAADSHVAVIYVHGIGNQRRYEETCRLIERLDLHLIDKDKTAATQERLRTISGAPETGFAKREDTFVHIGATYSPGTTGKPRRTLRFYELYWAPVMTGQTSALGVLKWAFSQTLRPLATLRTPWRERQRLRRASLAEVYERGLPKVTGGPSSWPEGVVHRDFGTLAELYADFDGNAERTQYPVGRYSEFLSYLAARLSPPPTQTAAGEAQQAAAKVARLTALTAAWRKTYILGELRAAFLLITLGLGLGLAIVGALLLIALAIGWIWRGPFHDWAAALSKDPLSVATTLSVGAYVAGATGVSRVLVDYLGDVQAWATYEETDAKYQARAKVLDTGLALLNQVLADPACDRLVIVSHSLGTAIAQDVVLSAATSNRAPGRPQVPLERISHFVTLGSPIDKIEYFFESSRSQFHRYLQVVDKLRGDISSKPFCDPPGRPAIHWLNIWDDADLIAGALQSPAGRDGMTQRVDNLHVSSLPFPDPAASHSAYFGNPKVLELLVGIICRDDLSFSGPVAHGAPQPWTGAFVGATQSDAVGKRAFWMILALSLPWLALFAALGQIPGRFASHAGTAAPAPLPWLSFASLAPAVAVVLLLAAGYVVVRRPGLAP